MRQFLKATFLRMEQNTGIQAIQNGVVMAIPAFLCGSTALLLLSLPLHGYQVLLHSSAWKPLFTLLTIIHGCTLDIITLILLITISLSFEKQLKLNTGGMLVFVNLSAYLIFSWDEQKRFAFSLFQSTHLFNALIVVLASSFIYRYLAQFAKQHFHYQEFGDHRFIHAMHAIFPMLIILLLFALLHLLMNIFGIHNIQSLMSDLMLEIFSSLGTTLLSGIVFIFTLHLMWFFGIHGGNVLDHVARNYFVLQQGSTQIMSKTFLDTFVLFGGCGTILCFIIAIFIVERRSMIRRFVGFASIPAFFNMNELMMFGIPIVLNPIYMIPFIITPIALTIISYTVMFFHLVPIPITSVEWTSPIFISGYVATGSYTGIILQLFNLIIGILIYIPFVKFSVHHRAQQQSKQVRHLQALVEEHETSGVPIALMALDGEAGEMARYLLHEILQEFKEGHISLHYQPQVNKHGHVLGAEALLRCHVKDIGYLYPPLVISLLKENDSLKLLRDLLIHQVFHDLKQLQDLGYNHLIISMNLTAEQLADAQLIPFIQQEIKNSGVNSSSIGLELTEQAALEITQKNISQIMELRKLGSRIIMDDFGMGHSSMMYLLNNQFDCVKLDGSLVKQLENDGRSTKIIASIMQLSKSLHFDVVAEFVEYESQQKQLDELGCHIYQGWLYSKALPFDTFLAYLKDHHE